MKSKIFSLIVIIALFSTSFAQESSDTNQTATVETKLKQAMQEWERPDRLGGVVAVVQKGEVIYKKCFGQANAEYMNPNTPKTA